MKLNFCHILMIYISLGSGCSYKGYYCSTNHSQVTISKAGKTLFSKSKVDRSDSLIFLLHSFDTLQRFFVSCDGIEIDLEAAQINGMSQASFKLHRTKHKRPVEVSLTNGDEKCCFRVNGKFPLTRVIFYKDNWYIQYRKTYLVLD